MSRPISSQQHASNSNQPNPTHNQDSPGPKALLLIQGGMKPLGVIPVDTFEESLRDCFYTMTTC